MKDLFEGKMKQDELVFQAILCWIYLKRQFMKIDLFVAVIT